MPLPLISCICVTRKRPVLLSRAIGCFLKQTYYNKELIVLYEDDDMQTGTMLKNLPLPASIKVFKIKGSVQQKLGTLRNIAIEKSSGEWICQWDDDDWYHDERLTAQFSRINETRLPANVMDQWIMADITSGRFYMSCKRNWEGSILFSRTLLNVAHYPNLRRGEDSVFVEEITKKGLMSTTQNKAWLYIYCFHAKNTFGIRHFNNLFRNSEQLPEIFTPALELALSGNLQANASAILTNTFNSML